MMRSAKKKDGHEQLDVLEELFKEPAEHHSPDKTERAFLSLEMLRVFSLPPAQVHYL